MKPSLDDADAVVKKLPPLLRDRFETSAGKKEMERALLDKRLLVEEAKRRGYQEKAEIRAEVSELEERLIVKALLHDQVEKETPTDAQLLAYYEGHPSTFTEPERVHVGRVFVAGHGDAASAQKKIRGLRKRLQDGEALGTVANDGDGAERVRGGDFGIVKKDHADRALVSAAFALLKPGDISELIGTEGGFSVFVLKERLPARLVPFAEARPDVIAHLEPELERRAFEGLIKELRADEKSEAGR